jgi:metal-responsive CopG/Arc/MetJ family transcriptional regulator
MNDGANAVRISATLPAYLAQYLEQYQRTHKLETRSQALTEAVLALREQEITRGYDEIAKAERSGELTYENLTNGDGLDPEDAAAWK